MLCLLYYLSCTVICCFGVKFLFVFWSLHLLFPFHLPSYLVLLVALSFSYTVAYAFISLAEISLQILHTISTIKRENILFLKLSVDSDINCFYVKSHYLLAADNWHSHCSIHSINNFVSVRCKLVRLDFICSWRQDITTQSSKNFKNQYSFVLFMH